MAHYYLAMHPKTGKIAFVTYREDIAIDLLRSITMEFLWEFTYNPPRPDITERDILRMENEHLFSSGILDEQQIRELRDHGTVILN
jgi:hypothetical protein